MIKFLEVFRYKSGVSIKQLFFMSYAGMIRGAVAFGLVLRVEHTVTHRSVIVTTVLVLVCLTCVLLGSTVGLVQHILFSKELAA